MNFAKHKTKQQQYQQQQKTLNVGTSTCIYLSVHPLTIRHNASQICLNEFSCA